MCSRFQNQTFVVELFQAGGEKTLKMADDLGTVGVLIDKVTFLNKWPQLNKATSDDETPTPGYLYQEINALSLQSGSYCQDLLDFLVDRLENGSYHVKLKSLRVIRFIVENGHPEFRQGLRKRAQGIQEAIKYSGPPDPLHGNAPYLLVRKEAKELSGILFDVGRDDGNIPHKQPVYMKSTGGMGSSNRGHRMEGFGNTPTRPMSLGESLVTGISKLAEKALGDEAPKPNLSLQRAEHHFGAYQPAEMSRVDNEHDRRVAPTAFDSSRRKDAERRPAVVKTRKAQRGHKPGVAGGGWEDEDDEVSNQQRQRQQLDSSQSQHSAPSTLSVSDTVSSDRSGHSGSALVERLESVRLEDSSAETKLVADILASNNVQTTNMLRRSEITSFVKSCSALNCDKIVEFLNSRMTDGGNDGVTLKVLLLLEALLRTDYVTADSITATCGENLLSLYKTGTGALQPKARKILRLLQKLCKNQELFQELPPCKPIVESNGISGPLKNSQPESNTDSNTCNNSLSAMFKAAHSPEPDIFRGIKPSEEKSGFSFLNAPFASPSRGAESVDSNQSLGASSQESTAKNTDEAGASKQEPVSSGPTAQGEPLSNITLTEQIETESSEAAPSGDGSKQCSSFSSLNAPPNG